MRVKNSRAALLSDYEVLSVMREMSRKLQESAAKSAAPTTAAPIDQTSGATVDINNNAINGVGGGDHASLDRQEERVSKSIPSNLRSIQYQVLETLTNVQRPCAHQDSKKIPDFMDAIAAWERGRTVVGLTQERNSNAPIEKERRLTKGEKLMLINHAPREVVVLHAIVEEIDERFSADEQYDLLAIIAAILPLDELAMDRDNEAAVAEATSNQGHQDMVYDQEGGEVYVGEGDVDDDIVDDMDVLENEGRGEGAVDDEGKEDD